uniref:Uncharacterized protein n=1 Tax=Octopus bimaculoides TaxID=37653 RepID=A0A0L8I441_OCTBM
MLEISTEKQKFVLSLVGKEIIFSGVLQILKQVPCTLYFAKVGNYFVAFIDRCHSISSIYSCVVINVENC